MLRYKFRFNTFLSEALYIGLFYEYWIKTFYHYIIIIIILIIIIIIIIMIMIMIMIIIIIIIIIIRRSEIYNCTFKNTNKVFIIIKAPHWLKLWFPLASGCETVPRPKPFVAGQWGGYNGNFQFSLFFLAYKTWINWIFFVTECSLFSYIGHQLKEYYKETFYRSLLHTSLIILECGDSTLTIIVSSYKGVLAVFVSF